MNADMEVRGKDKRKIHHPSWEADLSRSRVMHNYKTNSWNWRNFTWCGLHVP